MNTYYREISATQPFLPASRRRGLAGLLALCAAASVLYYMVREDGPVMLAPAALAAVKPLDSVKTVQGDGTRALHIFESVDCSFCRRQEPELRKLNNVTIYRHLLPGHAYRARLMAASVLCARDPEKEWGRLMSGESVDETTCPGDDLDRNYALAKQIGVTGTPAFVFGSGRMMTGLLDSARIEKLLEGK